MRTTLRPKQIKKHLKAAERAIKDASKPKEKPEAAKAPIIY